MRRDSLRVRKVGKRDMELCEDQGVCLLKHTPATMISGQNFLPSLIGKEQWNSSQASEVPPWDEKKLESFSVQAPVWTCRSGCVFTCSWACSCMCAWLLVCMLTWSYHVCTHVYIYVWMLLLCVSVCVCVCVVHNTVQSGYNGDGKPQSLISHEGVNIYIPTLIGLDSQFSLKVRLLWPLSSIQTDFQGFSSIFLIIFMTISCNSCN